MKNWLEPYDINNLYRIFPSRLGSQTARFLLMSGFENVFVDDHDNITAAIIRQGEDLLIGGEPCAAISTFLENVKFSGLIEAPKDFDAVIKRSLPEADRLPRLGWYADKPVEVPEIDGVKCRKVKLEEALMIHNLGEKWIMKYNRTPIDFLYNHDVFGVFKGDILVSICCKYTWSGKFTELAAATHPQFRNRGYGRLAAAFAVNFTVEAGKTAVWNCFASNLASKRLAEGLKFTPYNIPDYLYSLNWKPE